MKRRQLPSAVPRGLDFLIPDNWSADQALAVVELSTIYASGSACTTPLRH